MKRPRCDPLCWLIVAAVFVVVGCMCVFGTGT